MSKVYCFLLLTLLTSCDFTSSLHKEVLKAQEYILSQDFKKATILYEKILQKRPSKNIALKIHYQLGEIYSIYLNEYDKALSHFDTILKSSEDPLWQVKSLEKIGNINFENLRNYEVSKSSYKKLTHFEPRLEKQDFYKFRYASSLSELKEYGEAKKIFLRLTESANNEYGVRSYFNLGMISFYQKDWGQSVNFWFEYIKREKREDKIVQTKFLIANAYETDQKLKEAYNIYYSILGQYPNPEVIKERLQSLYERRLARKR